MGEANAALCSYMNCPDRIRSVLEYYLGEKLPEDWAWEELKGFYPEKELQKMDSDLKYVLGLMKRSGSPGKYKAYIRQNSHFFSRMPKSAFDVIDVCTNVGRMREYLMFEVKQEGQEVKADMCKALDEIQKSAERKGMERGRKQGMEQGIEQGINKMNELVQRLLTDGRQGDLARAAADSVFRKNLFAEYHI